MMENDSREVTFAKELPRLDSLKLLRNETISFERNNV